MLRVWLVAAVNGPLGYAKPFAWLLAEAGKAFAYHIGNLRERVALVVQIAGVQLDDACGVDVCIDQSGQDAAVAKTFDTSLRASQAQRLGGRAYERKLAGRDGEGLDRFCAGGSRFDSFNARTKNDEVRRRRRGSGRGCTGGQSEECYEHLSFKRSERRSDGWVPGEFFEATIGACHEGNYPVRIIRKTRVTRNVTLMARPGKAPRLSLIAERLPATFGCSRLSSCPAGSRIGVERC